MRCRIRLLQVHGRILGRNLVGQIHGHMVLGAIRGPIPGLIRGRTPGRAHTTVATITMEAVITAATITTAVTIRTKTTVTHTILATIAIRIIHRTKSRLLQQRLLNRIT